MTTTVGVVLAGGQATRMGGHKKDLLEVGGVPLIERVVASLEPVVGRVIIVADDPSPYLYLGLTVIPDAVSGGGVIAGLLAGLQYTTGEAVLACACDLPFVSTALGGYMLDVLPGWHAVVPRCPEGRQPLFAVYGQSCVRSVRRAVAVGERRIVSFYAGLAVRYVEGPELAAFDPERAFFNVNTPADLALARHIAVRGEPLNYNIEAFEKFRKQGTNPGTHYQNRSQYGFIHEPIYDGLNSKRVFSLPR